MPEGEIEVIIDPRKTVNENANDYFEAAKKAKEKAKRIREMIESGFELENKSAGAKEEKAMANEKQKWFEHFRWFYSQKGFLVVAGKNANQNEKIYKRVMRENDLFLHAEIVGAPFTVIKNGLNADERTIAAAAQFAASYSRAWKFGYASVDVYSVRKEQLTKKVSGAYVKKGGIIITGERTWYRNTPLGLAVGYYNDKLACFPVMCASLLKNHAKIVPGTREKEDVAREIAQKIGARVDDIVALLPAGNTAIIN
ncbi:MAG: NFACT RNA binding domain-containing protein [Candidatus Micrarchaeia archaeon]